MEKTVRKFRLMFLRNVALGAVLGTTVWAEGATVEVHTLVTPPSLKDFQNAFFPASITDDHGFKLGGMGSGIWTGPGDGPGIFWMITDRGPNPQSPPPIKRAFPVPAF